MSSSSETLVPKARLTGPGLVTRRVTVPASTEATLPT